jgi:uncharacterized protein YjiS (DUF1127 family)
MNANPWNAATAWWRNLRAARAALGELDGCGSEITRIARDVGVAPSELYTIAAKRPDAADQLKLRLEALHLDAAKVERDEPLIMRDLERVCTTCGSKRRCVRDFVRFPDDAAWREYCPNAPTLDALEKAPASKESAGNCAGSISKPAA